MSQKRKRGQLDPEEYEPLLTKYYYNNETGFLAADKFKKRLDDLGVYVPISIIKAWLAKQPSYQDTAIRKKPAVFNSIVADTVGQIYQMDTMFLRNWRYQGYQYLLLVIDVHSRYFGAFPMKNKKGWTYTNAFQNIIEDQMDGIYPQSISLDREYTAREFKDLVEDKEINLRYSEAGQPYKNAIVERLVRTIRNVLGRWRAGDPEGGADWPGAIDMIRKNINNTVHRTIKAKPIDVWEGRATNNQTIKWVANKLSVGDRVRVLLRDKKAAWSKADDLKWSTEVYQIRKQIGARFKLTGIKGHYMEYELHPVDWDTKQRNDNVIIPRAQKANSVVARRLAKEGLGEIKYDVGGRPSIQPFFQLKVKE